VEFLPQLIASGLAVGSLYALMAVGFVLIFKTTDVVNFAHGDMAMVSTFVALTALRAWEWPFWAALGAAVVTGFLVGALANLLLRPAVTRGASVFSLMIATLGISMMINALAGHTFGYQPQSFPPLIRGRPFVLFDAVRITPHNALVFAMAGVMALALFAVLKYTRLGTAMRAMAQNGRAALLMGVLGREPLGGGSRAFTRAPRPGRTGGGPARCCAPRRGTRRSSAPATPPRPGRSRGSR